MNQQGKKLNHLRLSLVAGLFFVVGVISGWAIHGAVIPSFGDNGETHSQAPQPRRILELQNEALSAEAELSVKPDDITIRAHLGNLYFDIGTAYDGTGDSSAAQAAFASAIRCYEAARSLGATSPDLITDLGTMYFRVHRPHDAVRVYEEVVRTDPRHQNAWMNLGVVKKEALADDTGAIQAWERYLALNPTGPEADRVRAWLSGLKRGTEASR